MGPKVILEKKITNLEYMFCACSCLKNIDGLKFLDTNDVNNFSYMFSGCSSLLELNGLKKWNVSKGNNFSYMFSWCSSLKDINGLQIGIYQMKIIFQICFKDVYLCKI